MLRSRLSRRLLMALLAVVLVTAVAGQFSAGTAAHVWVPPLIGAVAAALGALFVFKQLSEVTESLRQTAGAGASAANHGLDEASSAVADVVHTLRADVASLQARQSELEQNTALLETVLGTMIEGVIVVSTDERMLYANRAARSLLDIQERDIAGRPVLEVARSPNIEQTVQAALRSVATQRAEFDLPRKQKFVALTVSVLPGDPCPGAVLVIHDVTELRRLERLRRDFVSNVSHELKTPLTSIQAYADTLMEGALDDAENNRVFLRRIVEQAERLQALIHDLLRLAKIESQTEAFRIEPVPVAPLVVACIDEHRQVATMKGLALETGEVADVVVRADVDGLRQILDNLVNNALNYTPTGGRVTVSVRHREGWGEVEVEDTGIGIAKDDQARIFERFFRVDRARSRAVGGTGLGLSIVKHLAQAFGGRVELTSELGRGSRFGVWLPALIDKTSAVNASRHATMI
jgi:two-component system phosphate regulon sensor histidine kinase PhoR